MYVKMQLSTDLSNIRKKKTLDYENQSTYNSMLATPILSKYGTH